MRSIATLAFLFVIGICFASQDTQPFRIRVRHADPWLIKAILEGHQPTSPELSTLLNFAGLPQNQNANSRTFLPKGHIVINPTDNAIWFFPDQS